MLKAYLIQATLVVLVEVYVLPALGLAQRPGAVPRRLKLHRVIAGRLLAAICYLPLLASLGNPWVTTFVLLCLLLIAPIFIPNKESTRLVGPRELCFLAYILALPALIATTVLPPSDSAFADLSRQISSLNSISITKVSALFLAFILTIRPGTVFTRAMLSWLPKDRFPIPWAGHAENAATSEDPADEGLIAAGRLIGNLERVIIVTLAFLGQYAAIGFVLTAKSIARFRFASRGWAEYYLLGTLASSAYATLLGAALKAIWPVL